MNLIWFCQMRPAAMHHKPVFIICTDLLLNFGFNTTHFEWRQVVPIRHGFESVQASADAREPFHMSVPGCDILITDRPVDRISKSGSRCEFKITPTLAGPSPGN